MSISVFAIGIAMKSLEYHHTIIFHAKKDKPLLNNRRTISAMRKRHTVGKGMSYVDHLSLAI